MVGAGYGTEIPVFLEKGYQVRACDNQDWLRMALEEQIEFAAEAWQDHDDFDNDCVIAYVDPPYQELYKNNYASFEGMFDEAFEFVDLLQSLNVDKLIVKMPKQIVVPVCERRFRANGWQAIKWGAFQTNGITRHYWVLLDKPC